MKKPLLLLVSFCPAACFGVVGLTMRFVDVTLESIKPGESINLRAAKIFAVGC